MVAATESELCKQQWHEINFSFDDRPAKWVRQREIKGSNDRIECSEECGQVRTNALAWRLHGIPFVGIYFRPLRCGIESVIVFARERERERGCPAPAYLNDFNLLTNRNYFLLVSYYGVSCFERMKATDLWEDLFAKPRKIDAVRPNSLINLSKYPLVFLRMIDVTRPRIHSYTPQYI